MKLYLVLFNRETKSNLQNILIVNMIWTNLKENYIIQKDCLLLKIAEIFIFLINSNLGGW